MNERFEDPSESKKIALSGFNAMRSFEETAHNFFFLNDEIMALLQTWHNLESWNILVCILFCENITCSRTLLSKNERLL